VDGNDSEGATLFHIPGHTSVQFFIFQHYGLHLLHVTGGVVALIAVGIRYQGGRYNADDVEITGLYWPSWIWFGCSSCRFVLSDGI